MKNYSNASMVRFTELQGVAFGDITGGYTPLGNAFDNPARIIDIFNDTDQPVLISFDGINPNIYVPSHSGRIYDYGSNAIANSNKLEQAKGTQAYISYNNVAPTLGGVFLGFIYASND